MEGSVLASSLHSTFTGTRAGGGHPHVSYTEQSTLYCGWFAEECQACSSQGWISYLR